MARNTGDRLSIGIVGGTGYTGVELLRILARHPHASVRAITSRTEAGKRVADMFQSLRGVTDLAFSDPATTDLAACDVVFFATPHGVAMSQARELVGKGVKIIDLAADFRLKDAAMFERWYKMPHACPDLLAESVYGLPEMNRDAIRGARIVGNPGCYPTTMQLGFLPLVEAGVIDTTALIADSKSGASGAGRKAETHLLLAEASDNFSAYALGGHRHHPEVLQGLSRVTQERVSLVFTPHLVPSIRGIYSTLYAPLKRDMPLAELSALFDKRYAGEPFIDVMPAGSAPETRSVRASNMLRLSVGKPADSPYVRVVVVMDNLVKGAAGQAVQNMNLMTGLAETAGLDAVAVLP